MKHLLTAAVFLAMATTTQADETEPKPVDETGFCYRFLEVVTSAGEVIRRREVVVIKPSSSLEADLRRMQDIEESSFGYRPGHMKLNTWHNGWFDGKRAYFGDKTPDCSGLPNLKAAQND